MFYLIILILLNIKSFMFLLVIAVFIYGEHLSAYYFVLVSLGEILGEGITGSMK